MTLVIVRLAGQRPAARQFQIALAALQRLDRGLLVDADHDGVLRRRHIETDDLGGFSGEFGIVALTPAFARGKVDLVCPEHAPDVLHIDIAEGFGDQRSGPPSVTVRRPQVENTQNAPRRLGCI